MRCDRSSSPQNAATSTLASVRSPTFMNESRLDKLREEAWQEGGYRPRRGRRRRPDSAQSRVTTVSQLLGRRCGHGKFRSIFSSADLAECQR